jgi:hypothetical protein
MDRNAHGASLAACQQNVTGPIRPVVAIHIACEISRLVLGAHTKESSLGKKVTHVSITPENVFIGYDGNVEVLGIPGMQRLQASPPNPAYYAPEQVSGSSTDLRTEVFALGVVLWELFAGTTLFGRATPGETRMAITEGRVPYVCDSNPEVPKPIADTLVTALRFDKSARYESVDAFAKALVNARAASGITAAAHKMDIGTWLSERVPRAGDPVASGAPAPKVPSFAPPVKSQPPYTPPVQSTPPYTPPVQSQPPYTPPVQSPPPYTPPVVQPPPQWAQPTVPELEFAPSTRAPVVSAPPPSNRSPAVASKQPPAAVRSAAPPKVDPTADMGAGRSITFDDDDDDGGGMLDMEIERNVGGPSFAQGAGSRGPGGQAGARPGGAVRPGLELAAPSRMAREGAAQPHYTDEPGFGMKLGGLALSAVIAGATAFALWKYVHYAHVFDVMGRLPHAFDGTSVTQSGAVSAVALIGAVALGFVGLKVRPHAWAIVSAGGLTLLLAIAMVTVTLGSTGEGVPPDGGLLVPYLLPAAVLLVSLGIVGRAGRRFAAGYGAGKALVLPYAAIAGAVGYLAFELSRFAR